MQSQRINRKRSLVAFTFGCFAVAMLLSLAQTAFYATFGAFAAKNFLVTAAYKPVSGAYRMLRIEADGVVQPGVDGDPESDEVRVAFVANDGGVTRYFIEDIVWQTRKQGGKLYREDGTLLSDKALNPEAYVPLISGFYGDRDVAARLPEAMEIKKLVYEAGWLYGHTYREPKKRQFFIEKRLEYEYYPQLLEKPELPFAAVSLFWLYRVLSNRKPKSLRPKE